MILDRVLAEILLNIDPESYGDRAIFEQGNKVIYTILKRTLCGEILRSLLL